jgi:glutathione reductase (NADPH)
VPTAVFSEPEIGVIGLTETQARQRLDKVDVYKTTFRPMKATLSGRDTRCFMKLLVDGTTDHVIGCHIVGPDAGELIQAVGVAVKMGANKADFDATMAVHPTSAEELVTLREKAISYRRAAAE